MLSVEEEAKVADVSQDAHDQMTLRGENQHLLAAMEHLRKAYDGIALVPSLRERRKSAANRAPHSLAPEILALEKLEATGVAHNSGAPESPVTLDSTGDVLIFARDRDRLLRSVRCLLRFAFDFLRIEVIGGIQVEGAPLPWEDLIGIKARLLSERLGLGGAQVAQVLARKNIQEYHRSKAQVESRRQKVMRDDKRYKQIVGPLREEFVKGLAAAGVSVSDIGERKVSEIVHNALCVAFTIPELASEVADLAPRRRPKR
jgi:hypothetical protein